MRGLTEGVAHAHAHRKMRGPSREGSCGIRAQVVSPRACVKQVWPDEAGCVREVASFTEKRKVGGSTPPLPTWSSDQRKRR